MTKTHLFPITLFVTILIFLLISGCSNSGPNPLFTNQPPTLISIAITPAARSIPLGGTRQFGVTGTYSDGSQNPIPASSVTWSSSEPGVMSINPGGLSGGLATPITLGTTTVSATYGGITASIALTITPNIPFTNWSTTGNPVGVAVDSTGSVYIAAFSNNSSMINKYNVPGNLKASFNVSITRNVFAGVAVDNTSGNVTSGNVYVTDYDNNQLNVYNSAGALTKTWNSITNSITAPAGVAVDSFSNVYVTDALNNLVRKYKSDGTPGTPPSWSTTGVPSGVAVDSSGNVYVADFSNYMIRIYNPAGTQTAFFSTTGTPFGVAVNSTVTKVYVADTYYYMIREFVPPVSPSTSWTQSTYWSTIGWPNAVAVDSSGNVYVVDATNNKVREYPPQ